MSDVVVDSSVVAKWILPEADSGIAHSFLNGIVGAGGKVIVVDMAFPEVANAIWKRYRQRLLSMDESRACLAMLAGLPVHVEPAVRLLSAAFEIAARYDRAVYDALFVALAQDFDLAGVTADEPLVNATKLDFPRVKLLRDWP